MGGGIDGRNTDSDGEAYLANHRVSNENGDAVYTIERDDFKTFARTNLARRETVKERPIQKFAKALKKRPMEFRNPREKKQRERTQKKRRKRQENGHRTWGKSSGGIRTF